MRHPRLLALAALLALASGTQGDPPGRPEWWSEGDDPVISDAAENNRGPANNGQAKHMAKSALEVLRLVHPMVVSEIEGDLVGPGNPIPNWNPPADQVERDKNHAPLLIGQLKAIAAPFYDVLDTAEPVWLETQLVANHTKDSQNAANHYPWSAATSDDQNKAPASIGQLKAVFSLRFDILDTDSDGLADSWEREHFLNLRYNGDSDPDNDGLTNQQELALGSDPNAIAPDSDSDGLPDDWEQANTGKLAVFPPIISASILPGRVATRPLRVRNDTGETLDVAVSLAGNISPTYQPADSLTGGVSYLWEDISTTGTLLSTISSSDDASEPVTLPFSFPFYGSQISELHVCSNGFLSTEARNDTGGPLQLPEASAPDNLIAPLWRDLNPAVGGDIFYQNFSDKFIVQFQNVARYGHPTETYTFQAVLFSSGEIQFRYASINGATQNATIGIQNAAGDHAAAITPGASYPASGLAIRFSHPVFFEMTPAAVNLPPHSTATLNGAFHSLNLPVGEYTAMITLTPAGEVNPPLEARAILKVLADTDSDGMPDEWEILHGFEPTEDDASGDPDRDGYTNLEEYENGTNPHIPDNTADADNDNDGMWDRWETLHGLDPTIDDSANDPDSDGLVNFSEFQRGTHPNNPDSDSDGMPDGWEVTNSLNPLLNDAAQDPDGDGLSNHEEFLLETDPHVPNNPDDLDNDGMLDAWEYRHGLDPTANDSALDPDQDDLTNLQEFHIRTNPKDPDTDEDFLPDGWEHQYQLDPKIGSGPNGNSGDPDQDGATNFLEWQYGCDPKNPDTDGDGTNDGQEIANGSDPTDPSDGGNPPPADKLIAVPFRVGDPSGSHSETWTLKIVGQGPDDRRTIKIASPDYGVMAENQIHKLRKNNKYEITLEHLRTDPEYLEANDGESDYDWEAQVDAKPDDKVLGDGETHDDGDRYFIVKNHWIVDNKDGLLGIVDQNKFDSTNETSGKKAVMMPVDFKLRPNADVAKGWDSTEPDDWTSVGVGKTNSIVRLSIAGATADLGNYYEIKPEPNSEQYISIPDPAIDGETTDFDINGVKKTDMASGSVIVREKANHSNTAGILKTLVFEKDTIPTSIHFIYDDRDRLSRFDARLSPEDIINELNSCFNDQCNVSFVLATSGNVDFKHTPANLGNPRLFKGNGFKKEGYIYPSDMDDARGLVDKLIPKPAKLTILVINGFSDWEGKGGGRALDYANSATCMIENKAPNRTYSHEVGHALRLAYKKQELPGFTDSEKPSHDIGPWPKEMDENLRGLMFPGKSKPKNNWVRKDDWRVANIQADRLE